MKIAVLALAISVMSGCAVYDRVELLVCDDHNGIHSWHGHGDYLEVSCKDGTVFKVDWI